MLNFNEISNRIDNPTLIKLEDLEDLRQLSGKYPYSAIFSQLYLKGLTLHNNISFDTELKQHAYRIPDRSQLFQLVHTVEEANMQTEDSINIDNIQENIPTSEEYKKEDIISETSPSPIEEKIIESDFTDKKVTAKENSEQKVEENKTISPEQEEISETESKKSNTISDLDRDIIAHAISSSIFLEVGEESEEEYSFEQLKRLDRPSSLENEFPIIEFDLTHEEEENPNDEYASEEDNEDFKTFTSWISGYIDSKKSEDSSKSEKNSSSKEKFKEIFKIEKRESEFYSPLRNARESLDESRLPVSETLAKVYAMQGNYPKAIIAYEKLMLKFPEKNSFFAIQIEILKKKIN